MFKVICRIKPPLNENTKITKDNEDKTNALNEASTKLEDSDKEIISLKEQISEKSKKIEEYKEELNNLTSLDKDLEKTQSNATDILQKISGLGLSSSENTEENSEENDIPKSEISQELNTGSIDNARKKYNFKSIKLNNYL